MKSQAAKILLTLLCPVSLCGLFYYLYDFSLRSYVTFFVYNLTSLVAVILTFFLISDRKKALWAFVFIEAVYLSVYLLSLVLGLNTSLFDFAKGVGFSLIVASLVLLASTLFTGRGLVLNIIFFVLVFIAQLFPLMFICYFVATGSLISSDIIIALAQTNSDEGAEFFISNVNVWWGVSFIVLSAVLATSFILIKRAKLKLSSLSYLTVSLFLTLISSVFLVLPRMDYLPFAVVKITSRQLDNFDAYKKQKGERLEKLKKLTSLKLEDRSVKNPGLYVLVIGESASANRMQVYGFERENTSRLVARLKESENNLVFSNVYSSWPQTVQSLSYALTQANQYNGIECVNAFSLIEMARVCGFDTYWLSNQRKYGMYETPITVIASTAAHEIWTNGTSKMESVFFDSELVKNFPKIDVNTNTLVVIHLMGSHQKYDKRLPNDFLLFHGDDPVLDSYDDTIAYTDYVVDEIYKKAALNKSFKALVYFSDHGEDPHLTGGHDPENVTLNMLHVPLYMHLSPSFVEEAPQLFLNLKSNTGKYFSNDLIFDLMTSLLGIEGIPDYRQSLNLASDEYSLDRDSILTMYGKMHLDDSRLQK
ncbi:MAG: sulfatase-like hydrolase/transferase [Succinivibrio sp.]